MSTVTNCALHAVRMSYRQWLCHVLFNWHYATFMYGYSRYTKRAYWCEEGQHWYSRLYGHVVSHVDYSYQDYRCLTAEVIRERLH